MNAEIDGRRVTPRHGKPVEIQALWYNALCIMEDLAREFGDDPAAKRFAGRAAVARWSFNYLFWNAKKQCLYDVVHASTHDSSVRPNQVFAISLCHPILSEDRARCVLHVIQRELLTPFGLRTLAPDDPQYRGRCEGGPTERSRAYHQGSVWLWLISPFMEAYLKTYGFSDPAREQMAETLDFLDEHLGNWSAGQAEPEIFDGDFPHIARGNTSGGWSVAEVRRLRREIVSSGKMQGVVT